MKTLPILVTITPLLTACVAAGLKVNHTGTEPDVGLSTNRARLVHSAEAKTNPTVTKSVVRQFWGEPDELQEKGETANWIYYDGLRWNGLVLVAILPLPLVLPVGHDYVSLTFVGETLSNIETKGQGDFGFMCPVWEGVHSPQITGLCTTIREPQNGEINSKFFDRSTTGKALGGPRK